MEVSLYREGGGDRHRQIPEMVRSRTKNRIQGLKPVGYSYSLGLCGKECSSRAVNVGK